MPSKDTPTYSYEVIATTRFAALHCWPECPYESVEYLRHPHRHVFHIKVWKHASHEDRDVEIIMLKEDVDVFLEVAFPDCNLGRLSCEDLAVMLIAKFDLAACEVLEDGENGAYVRPNK